MQKLQKLPNDEQLKKINLYLNALLPQFDAITHKQEEHWATPKEFLEVGYGDCEEYALIKFYSLLRLGFDADKLYLLIAKEKFRGGRHMVVAYFDTPKRAPLILDNLSFKILRLEKRVDLEAEMFINASGVYKLKEGFKLTKITHRHKEFQEIDMKVKRGL
jgi:predicted transglutaminase-like cysteine proteinase